MADEIIELDEVRVRVARERLAASLAERLSAIPCAVHGHTVLVVGTVEKDGSRRIRYPHGACCPAHNALLHSRTADIERELYQTTGYLRAIVLASRDGES